VVSGEGSVLTEVDEAFNRRVAKSLEQALGVTATKLVYWTLEKDYGISKNNVSSNPQALTEQLEEVFGKDGQVFLVKLISRALVKEFDLRIE
jgi:hypothetical protein